MATFNGVAERNGVLAALPEPARKRLLKNAVLGVFDRDAVLIAQGSIIDRVYFPVSGVVSLVVGMDGEGSMEVAAIGRDGYTDAGANGHEPAATMTSVMQVSGEALSITAEDFVAAQRREPSVRDATIAFLQSLMVQTSQSVACNRLHPIHKRLARWIAQFHDRVDGDELPMTHQYMSQMLGVRRASVTVAAGALEDTGAIRHRRGRITVSDRAELERQACECYTVVRDEIARRMHSAPG